VGKNEVQISKPARPHQEIDAAAAKARLGGRILPTADDLSGLRIFGQEPFPRKPGGDPCATYLVFFPELTTTSGADDGNAGVVFSK
jgi:hypothetical protein